MRTPQDGGSSQFASQLCVAQRQMELGDTSAALAALGNAQSVCGESAEQHYQLGMLYRQLPINQSAMNCFEQAIRLDSQLAPAYAEAGRILIDEGYHREAEAYLEHALRLQPDDALTWADVARARHLNGRVEGAIAACRHAVALAPSDCKLLLQLGVLLLNNRRLVEATDLLQAGSARHPTSAQLHNLLGACYEARKLSGQALCHYQHATRLDPNFADAWCNLGNALGLQAKLSEALDAYRRALEIQPDLMWAQSNLAFTMLFHADCTPEEILAENRRWNAAFAVPLAGEIQPWPNSREENRPLRIGYVSPDLCAHPVGRFMLPILESHDRQHFCTYVYSSVRRADATTTELQKCASVWRDVNQTSDQDLAELIRRDQIDILVDLSMHMAHHRLLVFARKPAPIQVTYLAYVGTTGLDAIDYRLTDHYLDSDPKLLNYYSERSLFLPDCYWCYRPVLDVPVEPILPADRHHHITLGSPNNFSKVTPQTLALWCDILRQIPSARLRISTGDSSQADRLTKMLSEWSINPERVDRIPHLGLHEYFSGLGEVDIVLDPFPYGGGTTTCDALWMGVPVVSLAGQTAVGRGGLSILSNVGLPELVATDTAQYAHIVRELGHDRPRLRDLRRTLRSRLQNSKLMDATRFTKNLEDIYRQIWQEWCRQERGPTKPRKTH